MNLVMSFKMAFSSIWSSKIRSFLTMLGIIIGVAAVIVLVSLVSATTKNMRTQLESMGTNLISVSINRGGWGSTRSVTVDEVEKLCEENSEYIAYYSPIIQSGVTAKYGSENLSTVLYGVSADYDKIRNRSVTSGRFLSDTDIQARSSVCVIGQYLASELFDGQDAVGQKIKLGLRDTAGVFTVIGVLNQKSSNASQGGEDDLIIIPYSKAQRFTSNANLTSFAVSAASSDYTAQATQAIEDFLYKKFKNENSYNVMDQAEMVESIDTALSSMTTLAAGIAGISLIVAGIGIMNIMLVTVTERTKEIGIRKSIGARTGVILAQFLVESAVISCIGGIFGIVLGIAGAAAICTAMGMPVLSPLEQMGTIIGSFAFSAAMGIGFGFYPAKRAARLNPVDALRHE